MTLSNKILKAFFKTIKPRIEAFFLFIFVGCFLILHFHLLKLVHNDKENNTESSLINMEVCFLSFGLSFFIDMVFSILFFESMFFGYIIWYSLFMCAISTVYMTLKLIKKNIYAPFIEDFKENLENA